MHQYDILEDRGKVQTTYFETLKRDYDLKGVAENIFYQVSEYQKNPQEAESSSSVDVICAMDSTFLI